MRGVCLIAYGDKAEHEAHECIASLRRLHDWPCMLVSKAHDIEQPAGYDNVQKSRYAKVMLDQWSPFIETLYLDVDTRVQGDLSRGFDMLDDGFEMLMTHSAQQGRGNMWHVAPDEREATFTEWQCGSILQLQGGVFWFRQCAAIARFFEAWRLEWFRWRQFDQAALLRALRIAPIKLHILGRPYNGGAVVQHLHGRAVR